jgi:hypothetical protein
MFANDHEKVASRGAQEAFQRSSGQAARAGQAALRNTSINAAGHIGDRLKTRFSKAYTPLRDMSDAPLVPVAAPPALASADDDDEDEDLKAGASVVETQFSQRAWAGTTATPWQPCLEGSWDDLLVLLAVTALPSAVVWITPSARHPLTKVMEWNKGVYPLPSVAPLTPVPPQVTRSLSADYAPVPINAAGETITDAA